MKSLRFILLILFPIIFSCQEKKIDKSKQFTAIDPKISGIRFKNELEFRQKFNIYTYRNFYNGGGVGIGDVDNNGFVDIYFTANMGPNRLYLNNGDLTFTETAKSAGVSGKQGWSTGVSMVDINSDGWLDIYVCNSGEIDGDNKQNELFINQGDGTFIESASEYGLDDRGYSTHAAFFDYDRDGDLDAYLLNNSFQAIGSFNLRKNERPIRSKDGGDKLYRNDNGQFIDVSEEAGIYGSVIGFGLGVTVGDIDLDGWQDLYISNDFFERDYIYMNNGDGSFTENLTHQMRSISGASMGADMADINNDGYPDIFVTEMLPEPNERLKTKTTFENWDKYQYNLENGYYHQFTRNMFHLNNGNHSFSEIGRMAGVEATDWSWGALISDYDNDGLRDLFVANGIYKDLTDQDYINYISTEEVARAVITKEGVDFQSLTDVIPSNRIPNYIFKNRGDLQFEKVTDDWGLERPTHSNGSAYADLDNDGDLDLVINNVNDLADIYLNNNEIFNPGFSFVKIHLVGPEQNTQGIGAKISVYTDDVQVHFEQMPVRGFQSSCDPRPNFGLGRSTDIDSIIVHWIDGSVSKLFNEEVNQTLEIRHQKTDRFDIAKSDDHVSQPLLKDVTEFAGLGFKHIENEFVDFDRDRLLYHMLSAEGPALCSGDLNGDGRIDIYIGGAKDQEGQVFINRGNGSFSKIKNQDISMDKISEDVDCACFDADGDGDLDLYVASGGNEFPNSSSALIDRLYINNGRGSFTKSNQILPSFKFENSSSISPDDFDRDGDLDLFVGVRARPFLIGVPADSYLLENDGKGNFTNVTDSRAKAFKNLGMVTDSYWHDHDGDGDSDLFVVGEWMGIKLFENRNSEFFDISSAVGLDSTNGWWNTIEPFDIDNDEDMDFVVGNHGLNSRFKASRDKPVRIYVNDFDQNGSAEAIICNYLGEESYPLALKHDLIMQLPSLKKKYVQYDTYKDQTIDDIFEPEVLSRAHKSEAYILSTIILRNDGPSGFSISSLPTSAQLSPTYAIEVDDFDKDGNSDILLGGNFYFSKPEVGRYDASYGVFLKGDGKGSFVTIPNRQIQLRLEDQVREFEVLHDGEDKYLIVGRNDETPKVLTY